jgi:hypothetical protein
VACDARPEGGELQLYLAGSISERGEGAQLEVIDALKSMGSRETPGLRVRNLQAIFNVDAVFLTEWVWPLVVLFSLKSPGTL